jgi:hypothetical protein
MTKQEWSRTCERVQARFDNLDAATTMSISQSTSEKTGNRKEHKHHRETGHQLHADVMYTLPAICASLPTVARPITPERRDPLGPSSVWRWQ